VVFTPPPVEKGEAPTTINKIKIKTADLGISEITVVLNPAVLAVID
jgi:hypothetical protein